MSTRSVLYDVWHNRKSTMVEQFAVLGTIQTAVVQELTSIFSDRFPASRTAGEQQRCLRRRMLSEDRKHSALIFRTKVKLK